MLHELYLEKVTWGGCEVGCGAEEGLHQGILLVAVLVPFCKGGILSQNLEIITCSAGKFHYSLCLA